MTRRDFLAAAASVAAFRDDTLARIALITKEEPDPEDDRFWLELRDSFYIDPTLIALNNVGLGPPPKAVLAAQEREHRRAASDPSYHIWRKQDRELDPVRKDLGHLLGATEGELALTQNATYGLQTVILGMSMERGDEILTTTHDYPRAITAIRQRERRDGIKPVIVPLTGGPPLSAETILERVMAKVTRKTKLVCLCHVTYLVGQIIPLAAIGAELEKLNIPMLCDGAQSIGLLSDSVETLRSPIYTACLHKWMMGPIGTGVLVVQRPWLKRIWPLHPADEQFDDSIIKFEQIGSHPAAPFLALRESIDLHHRLGDQGKSGRLQVLRSYLWKQIENLRGIKNWGSLDPKVCQPFLTVSIAGVLSKDLAGWLLSKHNIHVTTAVMADVDAIRISPNVFTKKSELDALAAALKYAAESGI
ncbi:MAG: aminotransferase class V-fold PLP-dependent enzyme [Armatimonadetes bacterium]|nr:aminotransferase class V-fold PLP-dependent enzyme [Armatimonadota bacterium]